MRKPRFLEMLKLKRKYRILTNGYLYKVQYREWFIWKSIKTEGQNGKLIDRHFSSVQQAQATIDHTFLRPWRICSVYEGIPGHPPLELK
jgi:hypothetical protein